MHQRTFQNADAQTEFWCTLFQLQVQFKSLYIHVQYICLRPDNNNRCVYCDMFDKKKWVCGLGCISRSFTKDVLNLLLLCMLTEYVQTSILLKTA